MPEKRWPRDAESQRKRDKPNIIEMQGQMVKSETDIQTPYQKWPAAASAKWHIVQEKLLRALTPQPYNENSVDFDNCGPPNRFCMNMDALPHYPVDFKRLSSNSRYQDVLSLVHMLEGARSEDDIWLHRDVLSSTLQRNHILGM